MLNIKHLTWTCHVCGDERPDQYISVCKRKKGWIQVNVRYCNDRYPCEAAATVLAHARLGRITESKLG